MKRIFTIVVLASLLAAALLAAPRMVGAPKTYQVTGPVLELTNDTVVVQKGSERWEIARNSSTKVTGDLKVGAKVTIQYFMTATTIDAKPAAAPKAKAAAAPKKGDD
jgi:hypothetical protein